jgi:hypothetical protein
MNVLEKNSYVDTINNMTNRLKYYGNADVTRISFFKLALKYRGLIRDEDEDSNGVSFKRKLDILIKRIEIDCNDIIRN